MEPYRVRENEEYVRYELHALFWTDLDAHTEQWLRYNTDVRFDESLRERAQNVYNYYSTHPSFHEV